MVDLLAAVLRWRRTARALAARHGRVEARARAPRMSLAALRGGAGRWTRTVVALHPRIELALHRPPLATAPARALRRSAGAAPAGVATGRGAAAAPPATMPRPVAAPVPVALAVRAPAAPRPAGVTLEVGRTTIHRIAGARARVEAPQGLPGPTVGPAGAAAPRSAPIAAPRTAAAFAGRPAMMLTAAPRTPAAREARMPDPREPAASPASGRAEAPPVDIQSLTDEVVRQIDRRVVAHRERMGRI